MVPTGKTGKGFVFSCKPSLISPPLWLTIVVLTTHYCNWMLMCLIYLLDYNKIIEGRDQALILVTSLYEIQCLVLGAQQVFVRRGKKRVEGRDEKVYSCRDRTG